MILSLKYGTVSAGLAICPWSLDLCPVWHVELRLIMDHLLTTRWRELFGPVNVLNWHFAAVWRISEVLGRLFCLTPQHQLRCGGGQTWETRAAGGGHREDGVSPSHRTLLEVCQHRSDAEFVGVEQEWMNKEKEWWLNFIDKSSNNTV